MAMLKFLTPGSEQIVPQYLIQYTFVLLETEIDVNLVMIS